jgi:ADP-ribose pyrophosphatase YjhB (NUDIX family)
MAGHMTEPEAAVAIVHATRPEDSVLLIRRSQRDADPWSGHWSFPGGRRSFEDRDLMDTALRELKEECGIWLGRERMEKAFPHVEARRKARPFLVVAPFLFRVDAQLVAVPDLQEAVETQWIPLGTIMDPSQHSLRPVPNWPKEMLFPAIDLNGIPLWGFTYRLLTIWLNLTAGHSVGRLHAFQLASSVLDFVIRRGLRLQHGWTDPEAGPHANGDHVVKVAAVKGQIPVTAVLEHFSRSSCDMPLVNCLEVHSDYVRVVGLAFEEYLIHASE